ncbi:MAG TPA: DUF4139 domain-containing protein, partial [Rhodanobacteraceae bacterium]|nr:DUF4139 domain-containing protein [Rhodanobacteraceae bacterium]
MQPRLLAAALALALTATASCAADDPHAGPADSNATLTIYHADNDALFSGDAQGALDSGHAVVHEQRTVDVQVGQHTLRIGGLPASIEPEAVQVNFGKGVDVTGRRIVLARGSADSALAGHVGEHVSVAGSNGQTIAEGTLLGADGNGLTVRGANGSVIVVHDYATVALQPGSVSGGGSVLLDVDANASGTRDARLTYSTSGMGWRAAYDATLASGTACRMHFDPQASIANRSGRDYDSATVKLIAGQPNLASQPRMYAGMVRRLDMEAAAAPLPKQATLGDYRSFTLPHPVDLPDGTVTLTPLYASSDLDCTRQYLLESGGTWHPPRPILQADYANDSFQDRPIASTLLFDAPAALPAGTLRAFTVDRDGAPELLDQGDIPDTPKGQQARVTLGESFDLRASRERTAFSADRAARTMDEAFRITLSNGGDAARTVTVREHPNRWNVWKLVSSSTKPGKQTPDTLEFAINVPAHGNAVLDYRVR